MKHLLEHIDTLPVWLNEQGVRSFRAAQIQKWVAHRRSFDFEQMTDLPHRLREDLKSEFKISKLKLARSQTAEDGTEKLLLRTHDNHHIECVLLRDRARRTICISSQVGCAMGCVFCASGLDGVERNLTRGEIIEQMLWLQQLLPEDERLSHIVMMGMGEPLANIGNVIEALNFANIPEGLGISARRITISTVGLPAAIDRLATLDTRYNLAISLHAPDDELRNELVPVNKNIGVQALLDAADRYFATSGRRLTFEYVMLAGLNDSVDHAKALADILSGRCLLLNVIPYNPVDGLPYQTPGAETVKRFRQIVQGAGIEIKFRQQKGEKINAACGQLRRNQANLVSLSNAPKSH